MTSQHSTNRKHVYLHNKTKNFEQKIQKMKIFVTITVIAGSLAKENLGLSDDWLNDMNDQMAKVLQRQLIQLESSFRLQSLQKSMRMPSNPCTKR